MTALGADPNLPFLDLVWSQEKTAEFFNQRVLPFVGDNREVTTITRETTYFEPGRQCVVLYSLQFDECAAPPSRCVVTFAAGATLQDIYDRHYRNGGPSSTRPSPARALFVPDHQALIEFFPMDWKLPSLRRATDPEEMAPALGRAHKADQGWSPDIEVLRYFPQRRCVLRYRERSERSNGSKDVIGKVYPKGPLAGQVARVMEYLHAQGRAHGVIIPKPLGVLDNGGPLLMESVRGNSLKAILWKAETNEEAKEATRLAAVSLAALHTLRIESREVRSLETDLENVRERAAGLGLVAPQLGRQVQNLLHRIARSSHPPARPTRSLIHGDYAPSQLIIDPAGRVAVLDFDRTCLGDPAIDVGNFMAKLHRRAVSKGRDHYRQLSHYFLAQYQANQAKNDVHARVRLFQAIALVRMAVDRFRRSPHSYARKGASSLSALLLEEATACLAEV